MSPARHIAGGRSVGATMPPGVAGGVPRAPAAGATAGRLTDGRASGDHQAMVIEWLSYRVPPESRAAFLAADAAVWTAALSACPGFLGKETWCRAEAPDRVELIIRWDSRAAWKAVPAELLATTEVRFRAAFPDEAEFLGCTDLDVV